MANELTEDVGELSSGDGGIRTRTKASCRPTTLSADLRVALMRTSRRLRKEKSDEDLSDAQYVVLVLLDRAVALTPRELAEMERVRPPTMTRTLAGLTELGLVTRSDDPEDGRRVLVSLTPRGHEVVRATRRKRDAWLARRLAALEPEEREMLARAAEILRRIADT